MTKPAHRRCRWPGPRSRSAPRGPTLRPPPCAPCPGRRAPPAGAAPPAARPRPRPRQQDSLVGWQMHCSTGPGIFKGAPLQSFRNPQHEYAQAPSTAAAQAAVHHDRGSGIPSLRGGLRTAPCTTSQGSVHFSIVGERATAHV